MKITRVDFRSVRMPMEDGESFSVQLNHRGHFAGHGDAHALQVRQQAIILSVHVTPDKRTRPPDKLVEDLASANVAAVDHMADAKAVEECHCLTHKMVSPVTVRQNPYEQEEYLSSNLNARESLRAGPLLPAAADQHHLTGCGEQAGEVVDGGWYRLRRKEGQLAHKSDSRPAERPSWSAPRQARPPVPRTKTPPRVRLRGSAG